MVRRVRVALLSALLVCVACDSERVAEPASGAVEEPAPTGQTASSGAAPEASQPAAGTAERSPPAAEGGQAPTLPPGSDPRGLAYGFDPGPIQTAAAYRAEPRFAAADLARGELLSFACRACHTFGPGGQHNVGPNLYGIFGREAAQAADFMYSDALRGAGLIWTPRTLEAWLVAPQTFIVGNNMAFAGYRSATDRRDLIAFLLEVTSVPAPAASVE